jgi:hypothetical protein
MKTLVICVAVAGLLFVGISPQIDCAAEPVLHEFELDACYSTCPCVTNMTNACLQCKMVCERSYWAEWDKDNDAEPGSWN